MIAVVGATGTLGTQLLRALENADVEPDDVTAFASERSHGKEVDYQEETLEIDEIDFRGVKVALIATPLSAAKGLIDAARKAGARVVDFSGAYRPDTTVPLIAPGVNVAPPDAQLVTVAGAAGLGLSLALAPLHAKHAITWVDVTGLYGAAFRGEAGVKTLERETADLLAGRENEEGHEPFAHRIAFNVIPQVGVFAKGDHPQSTEELALALDVARVLPKAPVVRATALHVPTFHGVTLCVHGQLETGVEVAALRELFKTSPRVKLLDSPSESIYPMPMLATSDDAVHIGRVRTLGTHFWAMLTLDNAGLVAGAGVQLALAMR